MSLEPQRRELERFNFQVVKNDPDLLIALRQKWHLDCLLTKMTYVVFVRKVSHLTTAIINADQTQLPKEARQLNPSLLPRGFQAGVAVLTLYVAESVDVEAQSRCTRKPKVRFAWFYLPAAIELSTGCAFYLRNTPLWGFIYHGKFRYLIRHLLQPSAAPIEEPTSTLGIILGLVIVGYLLFLLSLIFVLFGAI